MQSSPPSVNSLYFLWAAYLLVAFANIAFALWLRARWADLTRRGDPE